MFGLQSKLSAGELRSVLPKNASNEQIAEWRKENGIPESPDKYELQLAKGVTIDADDKPYVDGILKAMHSANASSAAASAAVNAYFQMARQSAEETVADDAKFKQDSEDALRNEYGTEYRLNMNLRDAVLNQMPQDIRQMFEGGRLASGDKIIDHPGITRWLVGLSRELNPVTTHIGVGGGNIASAIDDEIKQIETWMKAPQKSAEGQKYWGDEKTQSRYRELLTAREKVGNK